MGRHKIAEKTQTLYIRSVRSEDKEKFDDLCRSQSKSQAQVFKELVELHEKTNSKKRT